MNTGLIAMASVTIAAPPADVWDALVTPAAIKAYMFGATVKSTLSRTETDWEPVA